MTEQQRFVATKSIDVWLERAGLSLDSLQKMPPATQASLGRSWQQYQSDVNVWQQRWGCTDQEIARAEVPSYHSAPRLDGSMQPKRNLDKLNHPSLY